jgi:hypothetical protein
MPKKKMRMTEAMRLVLSEEGPLTARELFSHLVARRLVDESKFSSLATTLSSNQLRFQRDYTSYPSRWSNVEEEEPNKERLTLPASFSDPAPVKEDRTEKRSEAELALESAILDLGLERAYQIMGTLKKRIGRV